MKDAPERIWADPPTVFDEMDVWYPEPRGEATEYIRADLARPKVKPLVWRQYSNNGNCMAETSIGDFVIEDHGENDWGIWLEDNYSPILGPCKNLEEAKAAAQADYERRILEALE
jgi:hypothetical protein